MRLSAGCYLPFTWFSPVMASSRATEQLPSQETDIAGSTLATRQPVGRPRQCSQAAKESFRLQEKEEDCIYLPVTRLKG